MWREGDGVEDGEQDVVVSQFNDPHLAPPRFGQRASHSAGTPTARVVARWSALVAK